MVSLARMESWAVRHLREKWGHPGDKIVRVHGRLDVMKGTAPPSDERLEDQYGRAKYGGDMKAAVDIAERCVSERALDALADATLATRGEPIFIFPHPPYDDDDGDGGMALERRRPPNAIPFALANYLAESLGGTVNVSIVEAARAGRSKLGMFPRFLCQPRFDGDVIPGGAYVLVDDVVTTGGTLAALRSHIVRGGGVIAAATVLSHKVGSDQVFAITKETLSRLEAVYGKEIATFWWEAIGHDLDCLSESEGQFLVGWGSEGSQGRAGSGVERLHLLRTRLAAAAAKGE